VETVAFASFSAADAAIRATVLPGETASHQKGRLNRPGIRAAAWVSGVTNRLLAALFAV
jgi:hypothetical protein